MFLPHCDRPSFIPILTTRKIKVVYIFWIVTCKTKDFSSNDSKHSLTSTYP
jgi:hypothetical protein